MATQSDWREPICNEEPPARRWMVRTTLLGLTGATVAAVLAFSLGTTTPAGAATARPVRVAAVPSGYASNPNWSGYVDTGEKYTWVTGSWNVPSVSCGPREYSSSFTWDGLDGYVSSTVEQVGTYQDCVNGAPAYGAWWEMWTSAYGSPAIRLSPNMPAQPDGMTTSSYWSNTSSWPVKPGDTMVGKVSDWNGSGTVYGLYIQDVTAGWWFLTDETPPASWRPSGSAVDASADWVVELPTNWVGTTLSHYSLVTFQNASAEGNGTTGPIDAFQNTLVYMARGSYTMAVPSFALASGGQSFNDVWLHS